MCTLVMTEYWEHLLFNVVVVSKFIVNLYTAVFISMLELQYGEKPLD